VISAPIQLLLSLQDDDALISYCAAMLGPVEQGEGEYGDELLRSLDVFHRAQRPLEKAASALYCPSPYAALSDPRVEQLTGRDFSQARDRRSSSGWRCGVGSSRDDPLRRRLTTMRIGVPTR